MTYTKTTVCTFLLVSLFWTGWTSTSNDAAAAEIDWQKYMQSSKNISAIAAAVAWVDHCSKKLIFKESITEGKVRLDFLCTGSEEEATGSIEFERFGDDGLVPSKFTWAG